MEDTWRDIVCVRALCSHDWLTKLSEASIAVISFMALCLVSACSACSAHAISHRNA
jgi:hypothetical protein